MSAGFEALFPVVVYRIQAAEADRLRSGFCFPNRSSLITASNPKARPSIQRGGLIIFSSG
jgi:hypothetical protein